MLMRHLTLQWCLLLLPLLLDLAYASLVLVCRYGTVVYELAEMLLQVLFEYAAAFCHQATQLSL
jgi:hypothetical protein